MTFIQLRRESTLLEYIAQKRLSALALLLLIAKRAKRSNDHPDKSLELGEAYIGDYETYGVTEQVYRSDKAFLKSTGQVTFRTTNKGTIAKIICNDLIDININDNQRPNQRTNQQDINGQLTTNNNVKNISPTRAKEFTPEVRSRIWTVLNQASDKEIRKENSWRR